MSLPRLARRIGFVIAAAAVTLAALALPAAAHVTVNPKTAPQGGYAALTFRVPNETDNANTTKVVVAFPTDHPLASVSVKPVPGWTTQVEKTKLAKPVTTDDGQVTEAVSRITWTPTTPAAAIAPGQFQEFEISAGPLPTKTDKLVFKALQYYSDGSIVRWIDVPTGSAEPAHPAPTLTLTSGSHSAAASPAASATSTDTGGGTSKLTIVALIAGILGLIAGVTSLAISRTR